MPCLPRGGSDCCILWLPLLWLCACHCATPTPPEPWHHIAHCEDDCRGMFTPLWAGRVLLGGKSWHVVHLVSSAGWYVDEWLTAYLGSCFHVMQVSKSACVLSTQAITRLLKSKEAAAAVDVRTWPTILDTGMCLQHLPLQRQSIALFLVGFLLLELRC